MDPCPLLGQMLEELVFPIEQLEETHVTSVIAASDASAATHHVVVLFLIDFPVDVAPFSYLILLRVRVLRTLDAVQEDLLESWHSEEGHRYAYLEVATQVVLDVLPGELGQAVVQSLMQELLI